MPMRLVVRYVSDLSDDELIQIKEALLREFKVPFNINDESKDTLFFLLKQKDVTLAMGGLQEVKPVICNDESFVFYGVIHVVATIKGKGYGKRVVSAMKQYLVSHDLTGLGFCMPKNLGFYEKCGFISATTSSQWFVYKKGTERITNQDGQYIFYYDSSDHFMKKVLSNPNKDVFIPTAGLW